MEPSKKSLSGEDIVIIVMAAIGFLGSAVLYLLHIPSILIAVFLSTGLAMLVFRFLGGIKDSVFNIGAVKLSGSLAALIACTFFINQQLERQLSLDVYKLFTPPINQWFAIDKSSGKPINIKIRGSKTIVEPPKELTQHPFFNGFQKKVEHFLVTKKLGPFSQHIDLSPLPFFLSTKHYGGDYSHYTLENNAGDILYEGSIYRRQSEIVHLNNNYYVVSVVAVNHNPQKEKKSYAKFAVGRLIPNVRYSIH